MLIFITFKLEVRGKYGHFKLKVQVLVALRLIF